MSQVVLIPYCAQYWSRPQVRSHLGPLIFLKIRNFVWNFRLKLYYQAGHFPHISLSRIRRWLVEDLRISDSWMHVFLVLNIFLSEVQKHPWLCWAHPGPVTAVHPGWREAMGCLSSLHFTWDRARHGPPSSPGTGVLPSDAPFRLGECHGY